MSLLFSFARRLLQSSSLSTHLRQNLLHCTNPPLSSSCIALNSLLSSFFAAFHQTLPILSPTSLHFSTLHSFPCSNLDDPFQPIQCRIHGHDPLLPGLLDYLKRAAHFPSEEQAVSSVARSGLEPSQDLVYSLIWELRKESKLAFLAFRWGQKWGCTDEKTFELMIWVLGTQRMFNAAWVLVRDMHSLSMGTRQAMLVLIDRYASANNPSKAIWTFHVMEKFRVNPDDEAFYSLLNALCKYGNIEEAEEIMLLKKRLFPLKTEGFNIILNGWCNMSVDVLEAKRVWREMSKCCITPNATSYTCMISCFSKVGNLFDSLRLYDEMKKRGWVPGLEVFNALVHVLTRENCFKEALKIIDQMREKGMQPDTTTYNSMIHHLCKALKREAATKVLSIMSGQNLSPTVETYHAFLEGSGFKETLEILDQMKLAGLGPTGNTFLLILARFLELEQPDNALTIWIGMKQYGVVPDSTHYTMLVERLARCGLLMQARRYYAEMRSKGFSDDPKLRMILKESVEDKNDRRKQWVKKPVKIDQRGRRRDGMSDKTREVSKTVKEKLGHNTKRVF